MNLKKSILAVAGLVIGTAVFSQQLTFNDLINIRQKKVEEVEKTLSSKKWSSDKTEASKSQDEVVLKLENRKHEVSQWLTLEKVENGNIVTYQTANKNNIAKIENELVKDGYTFLNKSLGNEQETITYMKDDLKVTIFTLKSETNTEPIYTVTLGS